jgi:hypothetical protein
MIGSENAVAKFRQRQSLFFESSGNLNEALSVAFDREFEPDEVADAVIHWFGCRVRRDFDEVMLLAANGFGWGATAHLRGMYERAVTLRYLHQVPAKAIDFVDFDVVQRRKRAEAIKRTMGVDAEDESAIVQLEAQFNSIKPRFLVSHCDHDNCEKQKLNHTWQSLDFIAMAQQVGKLGTLIVAAYYMPLAQTHGTFASAAYNLTELRGSLIHDNSADEREADRSFRYAHLITLDMLEVQREHFALPAMTDPLVAAWRDYEQLSK